MNKLEMAHEFMMKKMETETIDNHWELFYSSWRYADAMQAEADKRKAVGVPEAIRERHDFTPAINKGFEGASQEEWQPDWSDAPEWANWWAMDGFSEKANWYIDKPYLDDDSKVESEWNIDLRANAKTYIQAPSFNYQGNWQDSLRKRPQ